MTLQVQDLVNRLTGPKDESFKIYFDTCSLVNPNFPIFWKLLDQAIRITPNKVACIATYKVKSELGCFADGVRPSVRYQGADPSKKEPVSDELKQQAKKGLAFLNDLIDKHYIREIGSPDNPFADKDLINRVVQDWSSFSTLIITEDSNLRKSLENIPMYNPATHYSHKINVVKVADFFTTRTTEITIKQENDNLKIGPVNKDEIIGPNNEIYINGIKHFLGSPVSKAGAEGCVYDFGEENVVCKIFSYEALTKEKQYKTKTVASMKFDFKGICFPKEVVTNKKGYVIGYTMKKASGKAMSIFEDIDDFTTAFNGWTRTDVIDLAKTFADSFQYLHFHGILACDFNPSNYLIVSPKEIYFIDTDSFQYPDFNSRMFSRSFISPENITEQYLNTFTSVRTVTSEDFVVAILIFYILTLGHHPYYGNPSEMTYETAIKKGLFLFPSEVSPNLFSRTFNDNLFVDGCGKYWCSFPSDLRNLFSETFSINGPRFLNKKRRFTPGEWSVYLSNYSNVLNKYLIHYNKGFGQLIPDDYYKNEFKTGIDFNNLDNAHIKSPEMADNKSNVSLYFRQDICNIPGSNSKDINKTDKQSQKLDETNKTKNDLKGTTKVVKSTIVLSEYAKKQQEKGVPAIGEKQSPEIAPIIYRKHQVLKDNVINDVKQLITSLKYENTDTEKYKAIYEDIKAKIDIYFITLSNDLANDYANLINAKTTKEINLYANNIIGMSKAYTDNSNTIKDFIDATQYNLSVTHMIYTALFAKASPMYLPTYLQSVQAINKTMDYINFAIYNFEQDQQRNVNKISNQMLDACKYIKRLSNTLEMKSRTPVKNFGFDFQIKLLQTQAESLNYLNLYLNAKGIITKLNNSYKEAKTVAEKRLKNISLKESCNNALFYLKKCSCFYKNPKSEVDWIQAKRFKN